jgi:hypothetical protein
LLTCLKQFRRDFPAVQINARYGLIHGVHERMPERTVIPGLVCYPPRADGLLNNACR